VVVDEREQVGLVPADGRAVERVAGPAVMGAAASNRPNASGGVPSGRVFNPARANSRWMVRSDGADPSAAEITAATWAAVRPGASRLSFTARSNIAAGVVGSTARADGTRASKPPARQSRIQRSRVLRPTRTRSPCGPVCSRAARARTSRPR
jgi:hypothetical protein